MKDSSRKGEISGIGGKKVTRRSFLKGAGTLGLGLAAASASCIGLRSALAGAVSGVVAGGGARTSGC